MCWHRGLHCLESYWKYFDDLEEFEVSAGAISALWLYKTFHAALVPLLSYRALTYLCRRGVGCANLINTATKYFFLLNFLLCIPPVPVVRTGHCHVCLEYKQHRWQCNNGVRILFGTTALPVSSVPTVPAVARPLVRPAAGWMIGVRFAAGTGREYVSRQTLPDRLWVLTRLSGTGKMWFFPWGVNAAGTWSYVPPHTFGLWWVFCGEAPCSRSYGRNAGLRLILHPCAVDD
jgi:hypothetical protein